MRTSAFSKSPHDHVSALSPEEWRIDMDDAWLVLWWCRQLGLTKSQLERAVHMAGDSIADVKRYLESVQERS